jgi:hypothetical protein
VPTALANAVIGINHPPAALQQARRAVSEVQEARELPTVMPAGCVKAGLVAFIELESDEACMEMRIGLGRVEKLLDGGDVEVAWWDMCGTRGRKAWPANPTFKPWKLRGRVGTSTEPKRCILPVPLYLTGTQGLPNQGRSIAGSSLKLTKRCVTVLRKYCQHV